MAISTNNIDTRSWRSARRLLFHTAIQMVVNSKMDEGMQIPGIEPYIKQVSFTIRMSLKRTASLKVPLDKAEALLNGWFFDGNWPKDTHDIIYHLDFTVRALYDATEEMSERGISQMLQSLINVPGTGIYFSPELFDFCNNSLDRYRARGLETIGQLPALCKAAIMEEEEWYDADNFDISKLPPERQTLLHALARVHAQAAIVEPTGYDGFENYHRDADAYLSVCFSDDAEKINAARLRANDSFTKLVDELSSNRIEDLVKEKYVADALIALAGILQCAHTVSTYEDSQISSLMNKICPGKEIDHKTVSLLISDMLTANLLIP